MWSRSILRDYLRITRRADYIVVVPAEAGTQRGEGRGLLPGATALRKGLPRGKIEPVLSPVEGPVLSLPKGWGLSPCQRARLPMPRGRAACPFPPRGKVRMGALALPKSKAAHATRSLNEPTQPAAAIRRVQGPGLHTRQGHARTPSRERLVELRGLPSATLRASDVPRLQLDSQPPVKVKQPVRQRVDVVQHLVPHVRAHRLEVVVPVLVDRQAERADVLVPRLV